MTKEPMYNTTHLERELLKTILTDRMTFMRIHGLLVDEWFISESRLYIFQKAMLTYNDTKSLISKETLLYEVEKDFASSSVKQNDCKMEIEVIFKTDTIEKIDFIIEKLREATRANVIKSTLEKSYIELEKGNVEESQNFLRQGYIDIIMRRTNAETVALHKESGEFYKEVKNRVDFPEKYTGIKTGFKKLDDMSGGLFPAELTIFFGLSGKGKSTVLKNVCSNIRQQGYNVLHVANEENLFQVQTKYHARETQIEQAKFKRGTITDAELEKWKEYNEAQKAKTGEIYVRVIPQSTDATLIEQAFIELQQKGIKIDVICVDYMDLMAPTRRAYSENDEQAKITNDLKQLCVDCNVPLITATQAATNSEKQEQKDNPFLTMSDIYGTKRKGHSANMLIGIVNKSATAAAIEKPIEERNIQKIVFCVPKNRDGALFTFKQRLIADIGLIEEDDDIDVDSETEAVETYAEHIIEETKTEKVGVPKKLEETRSEIKQLVEKVKTRQNENESKKDEPLAVAVAVEPKTDNADVKKEEVKMEIKEELQVESKITFEKPKSILDLWKKKNE